MTFSCRINGCSFESDSPLGIVAHATAHKNEFARIVGRRPDDYDEVLALFNDREGPDDHTPTCVCGQAMYDQAKEHVPLQHFAECPAHGGADGE